jgi:membrane protein DedA with SNARE-associated domain
VSIEAVVARYGLAALFLGAGLEGETAVITGGLLAHEGLLSLPGAAACAVLGSFAADQLFFAAGRRYRDRPIVRNVMRRPAFARALRLLERRPVGFILAFRFVYGFRTVSPVAVGTSQVPTATFVPLNLLAATIWGLLFTGIGYLFGNGLADLLGRLKPSRAELGLGGGLTLVAVGLAALGIAIWRWRRAA